MRGAAALALFLVTSAALASCGLATNGPIPGSEDITLVCVDDPKIWPDYRHSALGVTLPEDLPPGVRIDAVDLVNPDGITIGAPYLIPVYRNPEGGHTTLGFDPFPPTENFPKEWAQAVPAIGDPVPTDTPVTVVVEMLLDDGRDHGSVDGVRITYSVAGRHYQAVFNQGAALNKGACDPEPASTDEESV